MPINPRVTRAGPVHDFAAETPVGRDVYEAYASHDPVPVVVRSARDGEIGVGEMTASLDPSNPDLLLGSIAWGADIEARAGDTEPAAHCEFDDAGRLVRVVVELDDDDDDESTTDDPLTDEPDADGPPRDGEDDDVNHEPEDAEMATDQSRAGEMPDADNLTPDQIAAEHQRTVIALKKANKEAAERRHEVEEYRRKEREAEEAKLGEADRIRIASEEANRKSRENEARAVAAEARLVQLTVDREIERHAGTLKFEYPDIAPSLIDRDRIEFDEDSGAALNLLRLVKELAEKRPALLQAARGAGTPPRNAPAQRQGGGNNANPAGPAPPDRVSELRSKVRYGA